MRTCLNVLRHQSENDLRWSVPSSVIVSAEPKAQIAHHTKAVSSLNALLVTSLSTVASSSRRNVATSAVSCVGTTECSDLRKKSSVGPTYLLKSSCTTPFISSLYTPSFWLCTQLAIMERHW